MNTQERQTEIQRLKQEHREALATPRLSDGNISPWQVSQMSARQKAQWQAKVSERFDVESRIRLLERTDEQIADTERKEQERKNSGRIQQIDSLIEMMRRFTGKNGKTLPKYAREIEKLTTERNQLTA